MKPLSELSNKELHEMIQEAGMADKFLNSPFGRLMQEAANRIVERVNREFALNADPSDLSKMWELKMTLKKYKYQLFDEIQWLVQDGIEAMNELELRRESAPTTDDDQES
jgi:hypothetical protein